MYNKRELFSYSPTQWERHLKNLLFLINRETTKHEQNEKDIIFLPKILQKKDEL